MILRKCYMHNFFGTTILTSIEQSVKNSTKNNKKKQSLPSHRHDELSSNHTVQNVIEINSTGVGNRVKENGRYYYVWGGQFHNPRGFVLPTMNLHTLITYWFVRSEHPVVPPLKYVKPFDFEEKKRSSMQGMLSQMKKLMSGVLAAATRIESFNPGNRGQNIKTAEDAAFIFNKVRVYFDFQSGGRHKRRLNALTWKTVSNLYQKNQYKFANA